MKNSQKILIPILILVVVALAVLIISVKTKNEEPVTSEQSLSNYQHNELANSSTDNNKETQSDTSIKNTSPNNNISNTTNDNIKNNATKKKNNTTKNVQSSKEYNLTDAEIINTQKTSFGELVLYSTRSNGNSIYLLVHTNKNKDKIYFEISGEYIIENIYYANVDSRFGDEIIIRANTGKNIEPMKYETYVLKITDDGFTSLLNPSEIKKFTSTFKAEIKSDYNITISNKTTGFNKTFNVKNSNSEKTINNIWNSNGSIIADKASDQVFFEDTYYSFEPKDVDEDGIYEIVCTQYASIGKRTNFIGYASTILKFDYESKKFAISSADFYVSD